MFFPDRIINIKEGDKVLEIGPGSTPYERSDVLLEKKYANEEEYSAQVGHTEKLATGKRVVFYDGKHFPFADNEFDYVICSHVLEHVEDIEMFLSEVFRVAGKGYFEYPLIYYEYLYNFNVHLNFLKFDGNVLHYMKKAETNLDEFIPVQRFLYESLKKGHEKLINDLLSLMMEGFEWNHSFEIIRAKNVEELVLKNFTIPAPSTFQESAPSAKHLLKQLIKKVIML